MSYQPADNLTNRTFVGLIVAQFLAGFNDQAIHAAAMFYAMHTKILSQSDAITLMPILFYSPWAIFCTLSGHYADKYSKTATLRVWKMSEIVISIFLMAGLYLGSDARMPVVGGWIVMACVFMMGTHAAFFAPAKYGAMPEILQPHILSKGNGILESTTFLASILGTVAGGILFQNFREHPVVIGIILLVLSLIGAAASFLIAWLPASSPDKVLPANPFKPLGENLKVMLRSRPLALAMLGIAFFVFMVSYMRASMYMHGETRNPRWSEEHTSLIVATVALGVGLGSPLAGYLSGGKIELGLVPLGCLGMILALLTSAAAIENTYVLVTALIMIGFFSGFYMVPLYTLLQHRAPKKSKGELVATSNFINVTGAIAASILFKVLVLLSMVSGLTPEFQVRDRVAVGKLEEIQYDEHAHQIIQVVIFKENGEVFQLKAKKAKELTPAQWQALSEKYAIAYDPDTAEFQVIDASTDVFDVVSGVAPQKGDDVVVSSYNRNVREHFLIRKADQPVQRIYDTSSLPTYLFMGAALMTLGILMLLCRKLPDFFVRMVFWFKSLGKFHIKAVGMQHLPTEGPVILTTNCNDLATSLQLISATDRTTKMVLVGDPATFHDGALLLWMAKNANLIIVRPDEDATHARQAALKTLESGHLLAVSVVNEKHTAGIAALLDELRQKTGAPILPTFCGSLDEGATGVTPRVRVVFGELMTSPPVALLDECKQSIAKLGDWIRTNDATAGTEHH